MNLARLLSTYALLLALLGASVLLAGSSLPYRGAGIMLLAMLQALGLLFGFTRLQDNSPLLRLVALAAWLFLSILLLLSTLDLVTREPT